MSCERYAIVALLALSLNWTLTTDASVSIIAGPGVLSTRRCTWMACSSLVIRCEPFKPSITHSTRWHCRLICPFAHSPGRPAGGATRPPDSGGAAAASAVQWRDTPAPCIVVNFPMDLTPGSSIGHSTINGATRVIAGSASNREDPPSLAEEPSWMKTETIAPAPAGCESVRPGRI